MFRLGQESSRPCSDLTLEEQTLLMHHQALGNLLGRAEGTGIHSQIVSWFSLQTGSQEVVIGHRGIAEWKTTDVG